jgi:hypothetical protein
LLIQGVADYLTTPEAYPTISMPAFDRHVNEQTGRAAGSLTIIRLKCSDGTVVRPSASVLLRPLGIASAGKQLSRLFGSDPDLKLTPELSAWIKGKAAKLCKRSTPTGFTVYRYRTIVDPNKGTVKTHGRPVVGGLTW